MRHRWLTDHVVATCAPFLHASCKECSRALLVACSVRAQPRRRNNDERTCKDAPTSGLVDSRPHLGCLHGLGTTRSPRSGVPSAPVLALVQALVPGVGARDRGALAAWAARMVAPGIARVIALSRSQES